MMWNPFAKNKSVVIVEKSNLSIEKKSTGWPREWLINSGNGYTNTSMTIKRALGFYDNAAPVAIAIDWINDEFKTLPMVLKNDKKVDTAAEILNFLKHPNDDMTQEDFLETLGAYFLITNEAYIIATGNINRPPAELLVVSPEFIEIRMNKDGFLGQINVQRPGADLQVFKRSDTSYRFFTNDNLAEIWQIKGFSALGNALYNNSDVIGGSSIVSARGRSKLSSIHREINQYIEVAKHNLSTLDNGLLPSGTITMPENSTLDDDQFERVRSQIVDYYSGAENAGKVLILDNGMIFTPMGISPKDMDFKELTKQVSTTIFNRYKVPLPLVNAENMTLANMEVAKLNLYDNCVTPLANRLFRELTNFLGERFKLKPDDLLAADVSNIPALQLRHSEQLKNKKELGIYTINEMREQDGMPRIAEGGDIVYINSRQMPAGAEPVNTASIDKVNAEPIDVTPAKKMISQLTTRKQFTQIMQEQKDKMGNRLISDDDIDAIADSEGL